MKILIYAIAKLSVDIFGIIGTIYTFITSPKTIPEYYFKQAISLDQHANVKMGGLFNAILGKGFGNEDETISSVLGKNERDGTLTKFGKWVVKMLDKLDKGHAKNSIEEDE